MPIGWFVFSTASKSPGHRCALDPEACRVELASDFHGCGAELLELTYDADRPVARAKVKDLDLNPPCRSALVVKWGARYTKALTLEEAAEAAEHLKRLGFGGTEGDAAG